MGEGGLAPHRQFERLRRHQCPRRIGADKLAEALVGDMQVALRHRDLFLRPGERGLGLRHRGFGDLADIELVLHRAQLLGEDVLVVDVEIEQVTVGDDGHIGIDHLGEDGLLGREQLRPGGVDAVLRLMQLGGGQPAIEDRLVDGDLPGRVVARRGQAVARQDRRVADVERGFRGLVDAPGRPLDRDGGPPAGKRRRHVLVGGAQRRPLFLQGRIVRIGFRQRRGQGRGPCVAGPRRRRRQQRRHRQRGPERGPTPPSRFRSQCLQMPCLLKRGHETYHFFMIKN